MQHLALADVAADCLGERGEQELGVTDPVGQRGAVERDALAGVDDGLAVQRLVIGELGDQHLREQARPGEATLDRQRGHRRLHEGLAGPA